MTASRGLRAVAAASLVAALTPATAIADDAPLACLPPTRASCDPHAKKDDGAARIEPRLRVPIATMYYVHTHEAVALDPAPDAREPELLARFFRDRTSWEPHTIAPACVETIRAACTQLGGHRVEIVSGYRSDKLNEMLRKKGHHVAAHSEHTRGHAVDFRVIGVPTEVLLAFVRQNHRGGTGYYPASGFVHVDVGRRRQWQGE